VAVYDAIVIGARVAGATTAMLLARAGLSVLVVDRASFPSDTLSTNNIQLPGVARLERWGLLGQVAAAGTPAIRRVRFDPGPVVLEGSFPAFDGVDAVYGPRRTLLDTLLVEAAREAGAEVRERFVVDELTFGDGRVTGIRGRSGGGEVVEEARLVVGADGKHSLVAKSVEAATYEERRPLSFGYYTYWDGVPLDGGEVYGRGRRLIGAWPTNDGLVMTYVAWPAEEFHAFRADVEGNLLATLDLAGDLGERVRAGKRAERVYGSADLPNFLRTPYGPGWALVGDAGLTLDPITALGINDALRDAELLSNAVVAGLGGSTSLEDVLAGYRRERDRAALPMYRFTLELAAMAPPKPEQEVLFRALEGRQEEIDRFLGVLACAVSPTDYFSPRNLRRLIGLRGFLAIARARIRQRSRDGRASRAPAADALGPAGPDHAAAA
jgi:2-polyprenyl-6-methoxyphenol hydroxylase-like FAD-dependent oxidoreductase